MAKKHCWQLICAGITLALVACEQSITGIPDPVTEENPLVEAVASVARVHSNDPCDHLVSWWPGDGNFDDVAEPIAAANNISVNSGVVLAPGLVGDAFSFTPGTALADVDFLEIADAPDLRSASFTVELWAKRIGPGQSTDHQGNVLIQKGLQNVFDSLGAIKVSYSIWWGGAGIIQARIQNGNVRYDLESEGNVDYGDVSLFEWVHIALTFDDATKTLKLYVNGDAKSQVVTMFGPQYGSGSVVIGSTMQYAREQGFPRGFEGLIDEVGFFDRALDVDELRDIRDRGKCAPPLNNTPVVDAGPGGTINEGQAFESAGSFVDPDADTWSATVDYDDGAGPEPLTLAADKTFALSHVYADDGVYTITVAVDDGVADPVQSTASVTVNNVAPAVSAGPDDADIFEGGPYASEVSFTDVGDDSWDVTVDYGDGSPVEASTISATNFQLSHIYAVAGVFTVTVTVTDDDGAAETGTAEVTVTAEAVIYEIAVTKARVRLDRRHRPSRDRFDVEGRLPLDLLALLDPAEIVTIEFEGFAALEIPAGALVRRDRRRTHMWRFTAGRRSSGIRKFELHDDGRFKIQVRDVSFSLSPADFPRALDFSITLGSDVGETEIEFDSRLRLQKEKSGRGKSGKSGKSGHSRR